MLFVCKSPGGLHQVQQIFAPGCTRWPRFLSKAANYAGSVSNCGDGMPLGSSGIQLANCKGGPGARVLVCATSCATGPSSRHLHALFVANGILVCYCILAI